MAHLFPINDNLFSLSTSIVDKYSFKTRMGMIPNIKKTNQDSHCIVKDIGGIKGLWLFGVMDGHGLNGHLVSDFVKKQLPASLGTLIGNDLKISRHSISTEKRMKKRSSNDGYLPPLLNGQSFQEQQSASSVILGNLQD